MINVTTFRKANEAAIPPYYPVLMSDRKKLVILMLGVSDGIVLRTNDKYPVVEEMGLW